MHAWHLEAVAGSPVVIVHGLGAASDVQVPIATELATDHPVYLPDLPGFGRSPGGPVGEGPPELADALADWLTVTGLTPAMLIANSAGCQVLIHLAVRHPRTVDRMVLQGPTVDVRARRAGSQALRLGIDGLLEHRTVLRVQARGVRQAGLRRLRRTAARLLEDRPEDLLPRVEAPLLVVRGSRDLLVTRRWAERVAALAPRGELVTVQGGPHALVYSRPRELAEVVRPFLDRSSNPAGIDGRTPRRSPHGA
jgi:2-hydroxy-6-oxonona-2,4-dienedioate hydrolase